MCVVCVCACMGVCTGVSVFWFLVASTEFGVLLEHHIGNLCVVALLNRFSPFFDAVLKRLGNRPARELALNWICTATRNRT